ncbi:MFS transporter [Rhodococcus olei]|uniref:MFS transporter n=2 Tax=Rhodococcus olei TaxID=2161675 RepID=A0ABP8PVG8_9NOCA
MLLFVINYADKAVLGIIAQPLARELGLTSAQIGLVGSLFFLAYAVGGFLAGPINKYLALRWSLVILAIVWSVAMLPLVIAASFTMLIVTRMLLGFSEGPNNALTHTAVYSWHPPAKRGLPSALLTGSGAIAKIALAPTLAFVTVQFGWRAAIVALSVLAVFWMVAWLFCWTEGPCISGATPSGETGVALNTEPNVPWRRVFGTRTFLSCSLLIISLMALSTVVLTWLPSYFQVGLGYSAIQAGSMFALPSVLGLILALGITSITDKMRQRGARSRVVRIGVAGVTVLISGSTLFALPAIGTPAVAVAVVSIGAALASAAIPLVTSTISELCPSQQTGGTMGMFFALMSIGGLIAPYATGVVVDHAATAAEGYELAFQIFGVVAAVAAILVLVFANPERDRKIIRRSVVPVSVDVS